MRLPMLAACTSRAHLDIEHWRTKLIERGGGDLLVVLRRYELNINAVWNGLLGQLPVRQPRPASGIRLGYGEEGVTIDFDDAMERTA